MAFEDVIDRFTPVATKTAIGTGGATFMASMTLSDWAQVVAIGGTIITTVGALAFQWLNYRLNQRRAKISPENETA